MLARSGLLTILCCLLATGTARPQDAAPTPPIATAVSQCAASGDLCSGWRAFRNEQTLPYQAISVKPMRDRAWLVIVSEPPPSIESTEVVHALNDVFGRDAIEIVRLRAPSGADGWLEDIVASVRVRSESTVTVASRRTITEWQAPQELTDRLRTLHQRMHGTEIGFALDNLDQPIDRTALRDLAVTPADVKLWADDSELMWRTLESDAPPEARYSWTELSAGDSVGTFKSNDDTLIALRIPSTASLSDLRGPFTAFSIAADLVITAHRATVRSSVLVIGRARVIPRAVLPPARFEMFATLLQSQETDLRQGYDRKNLFAGRVIGTDAVWDWAPITMPLSLQDSELGALLNSADGILKAWSEAGKIRYRGYEDYPRPQTYPFGHAALSEIIHREHKVSSLALSWNTDGYAALTDVPDFGNVITVAHTAALPISYTALDGGLQVGNPTPPDLTSFNELAYDYFVRLADPALSRVAQYAFWHQIIRNFLPDLRSTNNAPRAHRTQMVIQGLQTEASAWIRETLEVRSSLPIEQVGALRGLVRRRGVDGAATLLSGGTLAQYNELNGRIEALQRSAVVVKQEYENAFAAYCRTVVRYGGYDRVSRQGSRDCGIDVALPGAQVQRITTILRPIQDRVSRAESAYEALDKDNLRGDVRRIEGDLRAADNIVQSAVANGAIRLEITQRAFQQALQTSNDVPVAGAIRTPAVVLSRNTDNALAIGAHDIGETATHVSIGPARQVQIDARGATIVTVTPDDLAGANQIARLAARGRPIADASGATTPSPRRRALGLPSSASVQPIRPNEAVPEFPWPPPIPSAQFEIPGAFIRQRTNPQSLAQVSDRLTSALRRSQYEYTYYRAPGGFALVSRMERISTDGRPLPEEYRFLPPGAQEPFDFARYVEQLFVAPPGYYRLIVFVVTNRSFAATGKTIVASDATTLLRRGLVNLPSDIGQSEFTPLHNVTVLIFEFQKNGADRSVATLSPGRLSGQTHLQRAGLGPDLGLTP